MYQTNFFMQCRCINRKNANSLHTMPAFQSPKRNWSHWHKEYSQLWQMFLAWSQGKICPTTNHTWYNRKPETPLDSGIVLMKCGASSTWEPVMVPSLIKHWQRPNKPKRWSIFLTTLETHSSRRMALSRSSVEYTNAWPKLWQMPTLQLHPFASRSLQLSLVFLMIKRSTSR